MENNKEKKHNKINEEDKPLFGKNITVGICACGAPVETFEFLHALKKAGATTEIIMTPNAAELISPIMVQRETSKPVLYNQFELPKTYDKSHNKEKTDLFIIAPASANTVSKVALGLADNLLTTRILSADCPVAFVLRCNPKMYNKPVIQRNVETVKADGMYFIANEEKPHGFPEINYVIDQIIKILAE